MAYTVEKRCPRRPDPHLHEEEHTGLTLQEAIERVDDLIGVKDPEGIGELKGGQAHVWIDAENGDEFEVRRGVVYRPSEPFAETDPENWPDGRPTFGRGR